MTDMQFENTTHARFQTIVANSLRIEPTLVTSEANLTDLGAESLDMIEISMETESAFQIWLPDKNILETAQEVFGADIIHKDGFLTDVGKGLLMLRLRPDQVHLLAGEVPLEKVYRHFMTVRTWVDMIDNLARHTPAQCIHCGGRVNAAPGFRMKCKACGNETPLRSGEEINLEWIEAYHRNEYLPRQTAVEPKTLAQSA